MGVIDYILERPFLQDKYTSKIGQTFNQLPHFTSLRDQKMLKCMSCDSFSKSICCEPISTW